MQYKWQEEGGSYDATLREDSHPTHVLQPPIFFYYNKKIKCKVIIFQDFWKNMVCAALNIKLEVTEQKERWRN